MENVFSLEDFLSGDHCRSKVVEIEGIGKVRIHELTSIESGRIRTEAAKVDADDWEENFNFIADGAYRFLSQGKKPTAQDVKKLREKLSDDVLTDIYKKGLAFNLTNNGQRGDIEKNS